ncbi:MAG: hypothetical protein HY220_00120 [Candidatus Sungbacteria bacterium]|uniref:Protein translocase subunit SecA n=1 Tax=Candidatus Sungiibacteriota bacterium TaxID=2750080 RepID=A0A9D6QV85_9BACT|nr:hypothetical protein [Candidatus Sungbacteria bacterium]
MHPLLEILEDKLESHEARELFDSLLTFADEALQVSRDNRNLPFDEILKRSLHIRDIIQESPQRADELKTEIFALAAVAIHRVLKFFPNTTQFVAASLLAEGKVVELRTGEGKTVSAMIAAYWSAIRGRRVHIAASNDYLAVRDQRWMGFLDGVLGFSPGVVISSTKREERKKEYAKPIVYAANQELGFDYLRDHLALSPKERVVSDLDLVILDEVDSVLIDEARTPLIITRPPDEGLKQNFRKSSGKILEVLKTLMANVDYVIDYQKNSVWLTDEGIKKVTDWLGRDIFAEKDLEAARVLYYGLYSSVFLKPDREYMVRNGKVILVDEFTGQALPDRRFLDGLQQVLEMQAGIEPSPYAAIVATITYRNFFKLYKTISGMTGTAFIARSEFKDLYNLDVIPLEPHAGFNRRDKPTRFFRLAEEKAAAIVNEASHALISEVPLLLVGRSIASVKETSDVLKKNNTPHQVLHAEVAENAAAIIEAAGKPGTVTVASNIAGRGADIIIDESVKYSYGLRVIGIEHNLASRVDLQLRGRSGRQGQIGETQFFASLEDELFQIYADNAFWDYAEALTWNPSGILEGRLQTSVGALQKKAEALAADTRRTLADFDLLIDRHRHHTYEFRDALLRASPWAPVLFSELRSIFRDEERSRLSPRELKSLFGFEKLGAAQKKLIESFLKNDISQIQVSAPDEMKRQILILLDSHWQSYLENVYWLQDWVSIVQPSGEPYITFANEDPYRLFIKDGDLIFHDMRKQFGLECLRTLIQVL